MKGQYKVTEYIGVPVIANASGQYVIKTEADGHFKVHSWRTGKHSKGRYQGLGQIFLTENGLKVAVIATAPVAFKDRHRLTPMQRLTSEFAPMTVVKQAQQEA